VRRYYSISSFCLFCFLVLIPISSFSQSLNVIQKITGEPVLDGLPFESAWEGLTSRALFMLNPVSGGAPSQKSEAKIGYTDSSLQHKVLFKGWESDNGDKFYTAYFKTGRDGYLPQNL